MRFIDAHTHAYLPDDLQVLKERLAMLDQQLDDADPNKWQVFGRGDLAGLLAQEEAAGVERLVVLPITSRPRRVGELNRWVARAGREHPQVIPFGILHPLGDVEGDLALLRELGLKGVKLHPFVQRFSLELPESDALLGLLAESGLPLILDTTHLSGLFRAKPHLEPIMSLFDFPDCTPEHIARAAAAHPGLKIVAAHLGCLYGWERLGPLLDLDNVYFDLAFMNGLLPDGQIVDIIRRKGPQRIIYGTDAPWREPVGFRRWFEELPLTAAEKEQIAAGTISRLLGL